MVEGIFKNVNQVEEFLDELDEKFTLTEVKTYYVIDEVSRETFLSDQLQVDMIKP
mgnify:CR=1 FL=1